MKKILITGSTDGIGKLAAIQLAKIGHQVYLHGRSEERLKRAIHEIREATSNEKIDGYLADLSHFDEVKKMANDLNEKLPVLDVLINNAGIFNAESESTEGGYDIRFAVNFLGPYMLTYALLPLLKKSDSPRIINLSSAAQSPVSLSALGGQTRLSSQAAYAQSKLALTMWSMHLAKRENDIAVIPVNPGSLLNTKMVREAFGRHWSPASKGADILTELATAENLLEKSGMYFDNDQGQYSQAHQDAYNPQTITALIKLTETIIQEL